MRPIILLLALCMQSLANCGQQPAAKNTKNNSDLQVGGTCEGCEAVFESPVAFDKLPWTDTLPGFFEAGPHMLISGVIYEADGKTPAKDVILYIYHTDHSGKYTNRNNESGWAGRHGYMRGWMKTNEKGEYRFYTSQPASYPNTTAVKHIHPTIKEPGKTAYWIDEFVFDDDPFLTASVRASHQPRGGDGVVKLRNENGLLVGERNIYLGKNVPGYPKTER